MAKYICEFGERNQDRNITCTLNKNQGCKYVRYCTQDSFWWCSDEYFKCERRMSEMGKKDRRNYNLREDQIENQIEETKEIEKEETEQVIEDPIPETPVEEKIEEQEIKKESKPAVRSTLRRILY